MAIDIDNGNDATAATMTTAAIEDSDRPRETHRWRAVVLRTGSGSQNVPRRRSRHFGLSLTDPRGIPQGPVEVEDDGVTEAAATSSGDIAEAAIRGQRVVVRVFPSLPSGITVTLRQVDPARCAGARRVGRRSRCLRSRRGMRAGRRWRRCRPR